MEPGHARRTATAVIRPAGPPPTMATSTISCHSALKGVGLGIALNLLQEQRNGWALHCVAHTAVLQHDAVVIAMHACLQQLKIAHV
jgi:hypothetical protein